MKKILIFIGMCFLSVVAFAHLTEEQSANISRAAQQVSKGQKLLLLAKTGQIAEFRKELIESPYYALRAKDAHGNNMLHLASSKEMFGLIWNLLDKSTREKLVAERNAAGETPFMTQIMYGHEEIFLKYFPRTDLYQQLQKVTLASQEKNIPHITEIKKADLIAQCTFANQTMWQRANALYHQTGPGKYHQYRRSMKEVRDMIEEVAPFLKS